MCPSAFFLDYFLIISFYCGGARIWRWRCSFRLENMRLRVHTVHEFGVVKNW